MGGAKLGVSYVIILDWNPVRLVLNVFSTGLMTPLPVSRLVKIMK